MLRKLFTHTAIYGLAPYVPKLLGFFALPIITRDLTAIDYGVAGVIAGYSGAIGVFNTLGLRLIIVNAFYHYANRYKWVWRQIYGFLSVWAFVFAALSALLLYFIVPAEAADQKWSVIVLTVIPLVFFGPVSMLGSTYYQLMEKPTQIAVRTVIFGVLTIALNVYFISVLKLGFMGWFWSECIVGVLQNASYWYAVNVRLKITPIFNFKLYRLKKALTVAMPTIPHYYATYLLNSSDRMVMDWTKVPTDGIGKYNVAANFGNYFNTLSMASGFALGPMLNKLYKEGKDLKARNLLFMTQILFFSGTFLFSLWAKELFKFLIRNDALNVMYPLAIIIVMSYNYRPMYFGSNAKIFYKEKTKLLWRVTFVAGVINVVLNLVFIPVWGIIVPAVTTFISYMYMGYVGFYFRVQKEISNVNYFPLFWLSLTVMLTIGAYFLVELSIYPKLLITGFCLGLLFLLYSKYKSILR